MTPLRSTLWVSYAQGVPLRIILKLLSKFGSPLLVGNVPLRQLLRARYMFRVPSTPVIVGRSLMELWFQWHVGRMAMIIIRDKAPAPVGVYGSRGRVGNVSVLHYKSISYMGKPKMAVSLGT